MTDFVADVRAPTPSAAAEMITPTRSDLLADVDGLHARLRRAIHQEVRYLRQAIDTLDARLLDPATQIAQKMVQVDELEQRLLRSQASVQAARSARLSSLRRALGLLAPARQIAEHARTVTAFGSRLASAQKNQLGARQRALAGTVRALTAVSPLNTLSRGYAVLAREARAADGRRRTITSVADAEPGSLVEALLIDGTLTVSVTDIDPHPPLSAPDLDSPGDGNQ